LSVLLIIDSLQPFVGGVFTRHLESQMREPAVFGSAMPVLDACRDHYCVAFVQLAGFFAPFLIPAAAADAQQHLSAAFVGMMDMPVVAAARLKRHVGDEQSF